MKIAIAGFAREGQVTFDYWNHSGNEITICDQNENIQVPEGAKAKLGKDCFANLDEFDILVRTAGLNPQIILDANPETPDIKQKITTSVNEFLSVSPTKNVIGVTGSKGKGTTAILIAKMLEHTGKKVHLGGNMGIPPLLMLQNGIQEDDWVVLELSSFQLLDIKRSPHIAICLIITDEHVDYHGTQEEYMNAKKQLFKWQTEEDIAIYYGQNDDSKVIASSSPGKLIPYMQPPGAEVVDEAKIVIDGKDICEISEIKLLGKHNWQNICAAVTAVWQVVPDPIPIHDTIVNFEALPNRLEPVREINGIKFYNDSFSSNPGSVKAALEAVPGSKVLIVGGFEKKLDWGEFGKVIPPHQSNLRQILIIGEIGDIIANVLQQQGLTNYEVLKNVTMTDIVNHAQAVAQPGDTVLFSPGSSSFDMFKDFEDRGNQFREAVKAL